MVDRLLTRALAVRARFVFHAVVVSIVTWANGAHADPTTADALFRDGRRLLDEGRYDEACTKLAESQVQDPASGTLINLALCNQKRGKIATAWADYREAALLARRDGRAERAETAERKAAELERLVPHLIVRATRTPAGIEARWGNVRIGAAAFQTPIPVDPGEYVVSVSAPGYVPFSTTVTLVEAESRTVLIPDLVPLPPSPTEPSPSPRPTPSSSAAVSAKPEDGASLLPGLVVGGLGVVGLGVGTFFGLSSLDAYSDAERACPTHQDCSETARSARDEAQTKAWVANVALGVGVVTTGIGTWLVLDASNEKRAARRIFVHVACGSHGAELRIKAPL